MIPCLNQPIVGNLTVQILFPNRETFQLHPKRFDPVGHEVLQGCGSYLRTLVLLGAASLVARVICLPRLAS
jgi:hypothetical protein